MWKKIGDELSIVATLIVPNGGIWQVGLKKFDKNILFCDGWPDFVEYHSICNGYFSVFRYTYFCICGAPILWSWQCMASHNKCRRYISSWSWWKHQSNNEQGESYGMYISLYLCVFYFLEILNNCVIKLLLCCPYKAYIIFFNWKCCLIFNIY